MKLLPLFAFIVMIVCAGCTSTQTQPTGYMGLVSTVATETPYAQSTLSPIHPKGTISPEPIATTPSVQEPIIGSWKAVGAPLDCSASFVEEGRGHINCDTDGIAAMFGVKPINEDFTWEPTTDDYNFMRSYNLTRQNGDVYKFQYSNRMGTIVSDFLPDGSYLQRI